MITAVEFNVACTAASSSEENMVNVEYEGGKQDSFLIAEIGTIIATSEIGKINNDGFQVQDGLGTFVYFRDIVRVWAT
ncbi:MAG: hypothetical protein WC619_06355 [Patescibacteria group bacterium]